MNLSQLLQEKPCHLFRKIQFSFEHYLASKLGSLMSADLFSQLEREINFHGFETEKLLLFPPPLSSILFMGHRSRSNNFSSACMHGA